MALYGQYAENKFNGMNCGIMDQFAIAMGKENHAIFLDTGNLHYEYAPIPVSYTHLDVYKRQVMAGVSRRNNFDNPVRRSGAASFCQFVRVTDNAYIWLNNGRSFFP